ncbi:MAG: hypothetical protein FRX48_02178 [Lasallia pustulata]|uniref:DNA (cytosine-5-)-methyltransferase n=1 Tax=Lasallia pustulata TaxID=136370 RepID=A0A5M8PXN0_9LECA|nr:MAG: hypothetical protein FRX48_02178 [Lasallia pustulata]
MVGTAPNQQQVILIIDEEEGKKADRPRPEHASIKSSSMARTAQNAAIPNRTPPPYNRIGQIPTSTNSGPQRPAFHNPNSLLSSVATNSGLRSQPITTSRASGLSPGRFGSPLTRDSDPLRRQAKRPKLASSGTELVDLEPIRRSMSVIDLESNSTSKNRATESFKPMSGLYKELQPDMIIQEPQHLNLDSNAPGGFLAGDYMTEEQLNTWLLHSQGNQAPVSHVRIPRIATSLRPMPPKRTLRNGPVLAPLVFLESYNHNGSHLKANVNVELQSGDFMRIVHIVRDDSTSAVSLRGLMFQRTREMNGVLKKALNEVCWVLHVDEDDGREHRIQAMGEIPVGDVVKRRAIKLTNQPFPALSFRTDLMNETEEAVSRTRVLVCRWKYVCYYANAEARDRNAYGQRVIERIRMGESDIHCAVEDEQLRCDWRGDTIKGGASSKSTRYMRSAPAGPSDSKASPFALHSRTVIDLEPPTPTKDPQIQRRQRLDKGRYSQTSGSTLAQHKSSVKNPDHHQTRFPTQLPCDVFNSVISITDDPDPKVGMNWRTGSDKLQVQARQNSPDVIEVEGYHKATTKKGIVEQAYKGKFTSWHFHPPPGSWSKKDCVDSQSVTQSAPISNGGATSHSESAQKRHSRAPSPESDRTFGRRLPSVEFLARTLKNIVPLCPDFRSSHKASLPKNTVIPTHGYTYGDAFCGAGGMSRGALMAGLEVKWGFDFNEWACQSYRLNFPDAIVYPLRADQFSSLRGEDHKVDVLHLSPPCQFFSPAHTIQGKDDDTNIASLFAVFELLKKARPRIVTLEQTSGLKTLHPNYLNALVLMFTEHGFNIRYKICHLQDYGLPQTRSRLIVIASCPGEALPGYPKPTHSSNPQQTGLRPLTTINEAIRNISPDAANHDLYSVMSQPRGPHYDGNRQSHCITTNGGGAYHPSGRRFTHRELACLSGFPLEHRFCGTGTTKQIGNAVPPMVGKIILEEVRRALQKADGL